MSESPRRPGLEQEDDRVSGPWAYGLALLATLLVAGGVWWALVLVDDVKRTMTPFTADRSPPRTEEVRDFSTVGTMNVTDIQADSTTEHDRERRRAALEAYGWVSRDSAIVTIPIRRAMEMVADRTRQGAAP